MRRTKNRGFESVALPHHLQECTIVESNADLKIRTERFFQIPLLKGMEERHPIVAGTGSVSSGTVAAAAVTDDVPTERPPIDLFKSIFESESESDTDEGEDTGGEGTAIAAPEADPAAPAAPTKAPEGVLEKPSLRRGYGTDSSDESSGPDQHGVGDALSKKLEERKSDSSGRKRGTARSDSSRDKHGRKHKKHKKYKKDKKQRKHDSKRKRSSSSRS